MRRTLLAAAAMAPLLAMFGGEAWASCPAAGTTTSQVGDITLDTTCVIKPTAGGFGLEINSNNSITMPSGSQITATDVDNITGVVVVGGNTGNLDDVGSIALQMSYTPTLEGQTGIVGGVFATGTNRIGIDVIGPGVFNGSILADTGNSITIQGENSAGIVLQTGITGSLTVNGPISITGDSSQGIKIAGAVGGNVDINSSITANGIGSQGVVTSAPIAGQLAIANGAISVTGYRATTAPTNTTVLDDLGPDQLQQSGAAVQVGGSVGQGIILQPAITTGTGTAAVTASAGSIQAFGSAPALQIGAATTAVVIGDNPSSSFGVIIGGSVVASGVYSSRTTPNLPAPATSVGILVGDPTSLGYGGAITLSPTGVQILGGAAGDTGTVNLSGGIDVTGAVQATSVDAQSTGIMVAAGSAVGTILNNNSISGAVTAQGPTTALGIFIYPGASVTSVVNNGILTGVITAQASTSGQAGALIDASGTLTSVTNTGTIFAGIIPTDQNFVVGGAAVAIDVSRSTSGVNITQSPSTTFEGNPNASFTGSISGTVLTVTAVSAGTVLVGETVTGTGIAAGTTITSEDTGTGGVGTYVLSNSQTVAAGDLTAGGAAPSITGDIILGAATVAAPNQLNVSIGTVTGGLTEAITSTNAAGQVTSTDRNLDVNISNAQVDITKAELHQVTTLNVSSTGTLIAKIDPSFAIGASNPTPIFDTTVHAGQAGPDGSASLASGAQIGVSFDGLQTASAATYVFVHTSGPGELSVGQLGTTALTNAPFLYTAVPVVNGGDLDIDVSLKSPTELGLNVSETAAFKPIFAALQNDPALAQAIIAPTTQFGFQSLFQQLVPDQGIGTFEALQSATEKIAALTAQTPDSGVRIAGSSLWLQEVNDRLRRNTGDTLGGDDKTFGLVGGWEHMGQGGGAAGLTVSYLNIETDPYAAPVGGHLVSDLAELGAYYRRAWGGLRVSLRGAGGYAWFTERRDFVTTGLTESSFGEWNGYFADAHGGLGYEAHLGRFYMRPEVDADYIYLNEAAHAEKGAGPGFDVAIANRVSQEMSGSAIFAFGAQWGHDTWFRSEFFGGYRDIFSGSIANTVATFTGGSPFTLAAGDNRGGYLIAGFSLKAGTPLSYLALNAEADLNRDVQDYDIYLSGRAMF
jgi:hypothetical protein